MTIGQLIAKLTFIRDSTADERIYFELDQVIRDFELYGIQD